MLLPRRYDCHGKSAVPDFRLSISVEKPFAGLVDEGWLGVVAERTLAAAGIVKPVEVSLVIAGDETVWNLNRVYRGVDGTTDVLAFAFTEQAGGEEQDFVVPPDEPAQLGEVIISYQQAERQAAEHVHPLKQELALLTAHGVLHLLGYDHEEQGDEKTMREMEARVLDAVEKGD